MTVICKVTAPCSARVLGQVRPTMLCIHLVKWLLLFSTYSLLSAFLPAGRARSARPAGPKITLRFLRLYIYMYVYMYVRPHLSRVQ